MNTKTIRMNNRWNSHQAETLNQEFRQEHIQASVIRINGWWTLISENTEAHNDAIRIITLTIG